MYFGLFLLIFVQKRSKKFEKATEEFALVQTKISNVKNFSKKACNVNNVHDSLSNSVRNGAAECKEQDAGLWIGALLQTERFGDKEKIPIDGMHVFLHEGQSSVSCCNHRVL